MRLWNTCRGESGIAHWPDPGGVADQAAWVVEAFARLSALEAANQRREREQKGQP